MLAGLAGDEEQRHQCRVGHRFVEIPDDLGQRGDELRLADDLGDMAGPMASAEATATSTSENPSRSKPVVNVISRGLCRMASAAMAVGRSRRTTPHRDVGAHVLGHRVLEHRGDLVVAGLLGTGGGGHAAESRAEVPGDDSAMSGMDYRVAAGLEAVRTPAMQRLGFGHVLQHGVVL